MKHQIGQLCTDQSEVLNNIRQGQFQSGELLACVCLNVPAHDSHVRCVFQCGRAVLHVCAGGVHVHAGHADGVLASRHHHRAAPRRQVRQAAALLRRALDDDQRGQLRLRCVCVRAVFVCACVCVKSSVKSVSPLRACARVCAFSCM